MQKVIKYDIVRVPEGVAVSFLTDKGGDPNTYVFSADQAVTFALVACMKATSTQDKEIPGPKPANG
jgi:hypothetical protein